MVKTHLIAEQVRAHTADVAMKVVDHALEQARINREKREAERAKVEAQEARVQQNAEEQRKLREQAEEASARLAAERERAEADRAQREAMLSVMAARYGGAVQIDA